MGKTILKADKICKTFSNGGVENKILDMLDLEIYEGDFTVIMGASGAGKSTHLVSNLTLHERFFINQKKYEKTEGQPYRYCYSDSDNSRCGDVYIFCLYECQKD